MELIYRGIKYKLDRPNSQAIKAKKLTIFQKKLAKAAISHSFPIVAYCKQLFFNQNSPIYDPERFWHQHQSQFLKECWQLSMVDRLDSCWELTLKIELAQALKNRTPVKLKYRGVTYYR